MGADVIERRSGRYRYPSSSQIARFVQAARNGGVEVRGLWVGPDGRIGVQENETVSPDDEFTRWERAGRL